MSTSAATHASAAEAAGTRSFWFARVGSLVSLLPLGVWTVNHLWDNLAAFEGAQAWEASVTQHAHPVAHLATVVLVLLPLLIHAVWGIGRLRSSKVNLGAYPLFGNLKYILQRLSAVGLLGFLGAHLWLAMLKPRLVEGHAEAFTDIAAEMHWHTPTLIVYVLGTLAVSYHLANGLWSFAMGWGLVATKPALKRFDVVAIGLFLVLLAISWTAIYALYAAGAAFPNVEH